jgi:hypothetical protein
MPTRVDSSFLGVAYPASATKRRHATTAAPKKRRESPEHPVHVTLKRYLEEVLPKDTFVFCIENETVPTGKTEGARMFFFQRRKVRGVRNGMTDLGALIPGGQSFWLEAKAPDDGILSEDQQKVHGHLSRIHHKVGTACCIEEARWALQQAGISLREPPGQPAWPWDGARARLKPSLSMDIPF